MRNEISKTCSMDQLRSWKTCDENEGLGEDEVLSGRAGLDIVDAEEREESQAVERLVQSITVKWNW